ncbi:MAG: hypothetical protein NC187_00030 [Candidatus Amulumruptor caecigallinarius]|nr:hypothetical protein [Candidatus Amulumruptor caecigallinarius]MCM1395864.1 hypothetical protein [Candidatus Amulumruptor caecigallinarius]MCM1454803.1 hypothetical protein [bacterium]
MNRVSATGLVLVTLIATLLGACKPSEKSYREAYETAVSKRKAAESEYLDSTVQASLQQLGRPEVYAVGSDTLRCHADVVTVATGKELPGGSLRPFYVVAGSFKQVFNAKELLKRLQAHGHLTATVLLSRDRRYLTAVPCGATATGALDTLRSISWDTGLGLRAPYPWVLRATNSREKHENEQKVQ